MISGCLCLYCFDPQRCPVRALFLSFVDILSTNSVREGCELSTAVQVKSSKSSGGGSGYHRRVMVVVVMPDIGMGDGRPVLALP